MDLIDRLRAACSGGADCKCTLNEAAQRLERMQSALVWALGDGEDFRGRSEGEGAYWWRNELQTRAGLDWNGEQFVYAPPNVK